ncbi:MULTISPECIES: stage V sporulation protein AA [Aneurinibacillus]|uniref:Stage V sporulation protein AA n=1 Tax=Aneurinibacillus thermoaerophilus TaxID=143495 RepID=A0A1G7XNG1_ANETH|nr:MULTISPECIES: stage V sporulation protein AA [Aneurinibacillus]AMA73662.1 stage V sporulation protein AA [Aneurinibacillus sp. XH2]MED0675065.1 stage V sporulation protein AA [Aneurinibacillus thermoaerophilus]MED0679534.1 stage V sporulation protein AA [Aneurinibacillus thermoaerophilus]MED0737466.1 stage V sporulation protein AA [Aneurinibacillus thermoaerophilus]MED0756317.1 stage V sporulation protein AA [Aneurinibacillus thermoaerophilus]
MADPVRVYVKLKGKVQLPPGAVVRVKDVAELVTNSPAETAIREQVLHVLKPGDGNRYVVDMIQIIETLQRAYPELFVHNIGAEQMIIEVQLPKKKISLLLVAFVWIVLFIGSGLAIMNFHTDVSMPEVHQRIYELVTGKKNPHPLIIQIPYSLGVGAGMILFFNHIFRKKFNEEPSPLELEMFLYEQNVDEYVLAHEAPGAKKK